MPKLYPRNLPRAGTRDRALPVYLFVGGSGDEYKEAVGRLKEVVLDPAFAAFNFGSHDSRELPVEEVIAAARTQPMGPGGRLILYRDVDGLPKQGVDMLLGYAGDPERGTCLVLIAGEYDWKSPLCKGAEAKGILVDFRPPPRTGKSQVIVEAMAALRLTADSQALRHLEALLPEDRGLMRRELEKLDLALGERRRIAAADLKDLLLDRSAAGIYRLGDLLIRRDREEMMKVLDRIIEEGEAEKGLVGYVAKQYRALLAVREGRDLSELKPMPSKVIQSLREGAGRFTEEELRAALLSLRNVDRYLKSSSLPPAFILEAFFTGMLPDRPPP